MRARLVASACGMAAGACSGPAPPSKQTSTPAPTPPRYSGVIVDFYTKVLSPERC